jgi:hypothetical protein
MLVHAYILSVENTPRSRTLISTLTKFQIPFTIVTGATPQLAEKYFNEYGVNKGRVKLTAQELACTFGHRKMYQLAIQENVDTGLFFEDDAILNEDSFRRLFNKLRKTPRGILLLGTCGGWAHKKQIFNFGVDDSVYDVFATMITGSHAYIADKESIYRLFEGTEGLPKLADQFNRDKSTRLMVTLPFIALQEGLDQSYIHNTHVASTLFIRRLLSSIHSDLQEYVLQKNVGSRVFRLKEFELIISQFLTKLPGCNAQDSQIDGE